MLPQFHSWSSSDSDGIEVLHKVERVYGLHAVCFYSFRDIMH